MTAHHEERCARFFTYAELMDQARLERLVGPVGKPAYSSAVLPGYELRFSLGPHGERRANIHPVAPSPMDDPEVDGVGGAVFLLTGAQLAALDQYHHGVSGGRYARRTVRAEITDPQGDAPQGDYISTLRCETYVAEADGGGAAARRGPSPHAPHTTAAHLVEVMHSARAEGLTYERFWRPLPRLSGRTGGFVLAFDADMVREALEEVAGGGPVAWVGPARVHEWRVCFDLGGGPPGRNGNSKSMAMEGMLYLLSHDQLSALELCPDNRQQALTGATLLHADGQETDICIEEDVLIFVPPAAAAAAAPSVHRRKAPKLVSLPGRDLGQVLYGARKAGLSPAYISFLERLAAPSSTAAAVARVRQREQAAARWYGDEEGMDLGMMGVEGEDEEEEEEDEDDDDDDGRPVEVFVYGTLLRGLANHHLLRPEGDGEGGGGGNNDEEVVFLGAARTEDRFEMWDVGGFPFVSRRAERTTILGEVYRVGRRTLRRLDTLEGYPQWYDRMPVSVRWVGGGGEPQGGQGQQGQQGQGRRRLRPWMYVNDTMAGVREVEDGDYRACLQRKAAAQQQLLLRQVGGNGAMGIGVNVGRRA